MNNMFGMICGYLSAVLGAIYAIPQARKSIKNKKSYGISKTFVSMWLLDKTFTLMYVSYNKDYPLMFKYGVGLVCVSVVFFYKFRKKKRRKGRNK